MTHDESSATGAAFLILSSAAMQSVAEWDRKRLALERSRLSPKFQDRHTTPTHSIRNMMMEWEKLVSAMEDDWHRDEYLINDYEMVLQTRDLLESALEELNPEARSSLGAAVRELDSKFTEHSVPDEDGTLRPWLHPSPDRNNLDFWNRKPRVMPW